MVGIIVTQQIIDSNKEIKNFPSIGEFYVRGKLPSVWTGVNGLPVSNYSKSDVGDLIADGWMQYEAPSYDVSTQKLGEFTENGMPSGKFTKEILNKTANEIAEYQENLALQQEDKIIEDGKELVLKIRTYAKRKLNSGDITKNQFKNLLSGMRNTLFPLLIGDWVEAQALLLLVPPPANQTMLQIYNYIKDYIDNYITDNDL